MAILNSIPPPPSSFELQPDPDVDVDPAICTRHPTDSILAGTGHALVDSEDEDGPRDGHGLPLSWSNRAEAVPAIEIAPTSILPPRDANGIRRMTVRVALPRRDRREVHVGASSGFLHQFMDRIVHHHHPAGVFEPDSGPSRVSRAAAPPQVLMSMSKNHHDKSRRSGHHSHHHRHEDSGNDSSDDEESDGDDDDSEHRHRHSKSSARHHDGRKHHHRHHQQRHSHRRDGDHELKLEDPDPDLERKFEELGASHTRSQVKQWYKRGARKVAVQAQELLAKKEDDGDEEGDRDGSKEVGDKEATKVKTRNKDQGDDSTSDGSSDGSDDESGSATDDERKGEGDAKRKSGSRR